jgi:hypothetical protein
MWGTLTGNLELDMGITSTNIMEACGGGSEMRGYLAFANEGL